MFIFSDIHDWQGSPAIKQILVFPNKEKMEEFNVKFAVRVDEDGIQYASDSGIGACYKLRAVRYSKDTWISVIRSGDNGTSLYSSCDDNKLYKTPQAALTAVVEQFKTMILNELNNDMQSLENSIIKM